MNVIIINLIATILFCGLGFLAGNYYTKKHIAYRTKWDKLIKKAEEAVILLFKNLSHPQKADKTLSSILNMLSIDDLVNVLILRYDGSFLTNVMNNEIIYNENIKNLLLEKKQTSDAKYIYYKNNPLFGILESHLKKKNFQQAVVFPYLPEIFDVEYFVIFFRKKEKDYFNSNYYIEFMNGQISILLYLREILSEYKDKEEFINRLFFKNPISMCVTDRVGSIIKNNSSFINFSAKDMNRITQVIDHSTFSRVIDGHTLEKDTFYSNRNIKIYGMPLHNSNGIIKGGIFILLDESLQYLLLKKLEASEERYKKFLKELPIGLAIINQDGIIYFVNDNFISSLGFSEADKLQGNLIQNYFDIPDNNFKEIADKVQEQDFLILKLSLKNDFSNRNYSVHLQKILLGDVELIEATFQDISLENKLYAQLAEKTKLIEEELDTARKIWNHVLSIPPIYSSLIRFETFFKPSSQLGGDFCDIIQMDDYHIGIIMADVSGHGVSASLLTSMLKMLVEFSPKEPERIDDIINYLNLVLLKILPEDQYITLFYGIINIKDYTLEYINCGHPFPILYNDKTGDIVILEGMTYPLGIRKNVPFHDACRKVDLPRNCKIFVYTDGILSFRKLNRMMKTDDLIDIFQQSVQLRTKHVLNNMYMKMLKTSTQFADDDVSMLLIILNKDLVYKKFLSIPSNVLEIDNAILKITDSMNKIIRLDDEEKWKIYTALYETMINAVEHGNKYGAQKRVTVIYRILKNWIIMKVRDEGIGFDYKNLPSPLEDDNMLKPSGRGVYMVKKVMDKIRFNNAGNEITMFMHLGSSMEMGENLNAG